MRISKSSQRHFAWLLWLALLLPIGQTVASWHMLSHVHPSLSEAGGGDGLVHQDHCDLCPSAETLIGGAPLVTVLDLFKASERVTVPVAALHGIFSTAPTQTYNSRAPPLSTH